MINQDLKAIVLAAGISSRFNTGKSKQLSPICGQAMILYSLRMLASLGLKITVVLGCQAKELKNEIEKAGLPNITFAMQDEQLGTADAVRASKSTWAAEGLLILNGDMPLLTSDVVEDLYEAYKKNSATIAFGTSFVYEPANYGRILEADDRICVVEEKDCDDQQRSINKINAGVYIMDKRFLDYALPLAEQSAKSGEYYITSLIGIASSQGKKVVMKSIPYDCVRGVDTLEDLWAVEQIKRSDLIRHWMSQGVRFELAQSIHIDLDVKIGKGTFICTGVNLLHGARVGKNCFIGSFTVINATTVGDDCTIYPHTILKDSSVGDRVEVGPFAHVREHTVLSDHTVIGNFVEIKNSTIGEKTKAKHLTYLGNATVGKGVNIGAGTITCNHNGVEKNHTTIEDNAYVGSHTTLIAPINVGKDAYTAAGSTLNKQVPPGSLAIARSKQVNKPEYAYKLRMKKKETKKKNEEDFDEASDSSSRINYLGVVKAKDDSKELL